MAIPIPIGLPADMADAGRADGWSWRERYYSERTGDLAKYSIARYCEYPATLIRVVHRFLQPGPAAGG